MPCGRAGVFHRKCLSTATEVESQAFCEDFFSNLRAVPEALARSLAARKEPMGFPSRSQGENFFFSKKLFLETSAAHSPRFPVRRGRNLRNAVPLVNRNISLSAKKFRFAAPAPCASCGEG